MTKNERSHIVRKTYLNDNVFYLAQIWERNYFKRWITVQVCSSQERAEEALKSLAR